MFTNGFLFAILSRSNSSLLRKCEARLMVELVKDILTLIWVRGGGVILPHTLLVFP